VITLGDEFVNSDAGGAVHGGRIDDLGHDMYSY